MKEPIEPIIQRLMREMEDGSFEVAGYMSIKSGSVYYSLGLCPVKNRWLPRHIACVGKWDRVDRLLFSQDGVTYFEQDLVECYLEQTFEDVTKAGRLYYNDDYGMSMINFFNDGVAIPVNNEMVLDGDIKIVGIEGVTKTEEE